MFKNKDSKWLKEYNATRHLSDRSLPCHAPFNSMYFNVHGEAGPCWLNLNGMGRYPESSVREIWFGERFSSLRGAIGEQDLTYKCKRCDQAIMDGNHHSVLSKTV